MRSFYRYFNDDTPDDKDRLLGRARAYSKLGMYKEAIDECKKVIRLDPNDPSSFIELGYNCEENGEIEKAIKYYRYAIKKLPIPSNDLSRLYTNLGYCYEHYKKRSDIAMVCYEKALEIDPYNEWALNNTGVILQAEGKWKEAISYYEKSYEACKRSGMASGQIMHNLAWAYYRVKNYRKAFHIFNNLAAEDADYDSESVCGDFGCVNYKMGHYREALELFEKALLSHPDNKKYQRLYKVAGKKISQ